MQLCLWQIVTVPSSLYVILYVKKKSPNFLEKKRMMATPLISQKKWNEGHSSHFIIISHVRFERIVTLSKTESLTVKINKHIHHMHRITYLGSIVSLYCKYDISYKLGLFKSQSWSDLQISNSFEMLR